MATQVDIFRIFNAAANTNAKENKNTTYADLAQKEAQNEQNKSGISIMLEDFEEKYKSTHGFDRSCITAKDAQQSWIKQIFGLKKDNIFETDTAQEQLKADEYVFQGTLYNQEVQKNNGVVYAKEGDDLIESALNFAKADISAIERVYQGPENKQDGLLTYNEVNSYTEYESYSEPTGFFGRANSFEGINLDDRTDSLSAEEYGSYIIAADTNQDGKISQEEAQALEEMEDEEFQQMAMEVYNKNFK